MSAFDAFERRLPDTLDELASPQFPDYFDEVLAVAVSRPQRPAWTFPERWIPMSSVAQRPVLIPGLPWRTAGMLLMLLALLLATAVISIGIRQDRNPAPPFGPAANGVVAAVIDFDLYAHDLASGERTLLVGGPELDVFPVFSRDGLSLAWARIGSETDDASDPATLMVSNADGTDARVLVESVAFDWAAWSPDSDELAMISTAADGQRELSIIDVATGEQRAIALPVEPRDFVEWRPPDGRELVFVGRDVEQRAVYGVRSDGTGLRQISPMNGAYAFLGPFDVASDGSRMVYTRGGTNVTSIVVLDLESGDERHINELPPLADPDALDDLQSAPTISPDGESVLFDRYWGRDSGVVAHQLFLASLDGTGADAVAVGPIHRSNSTNNPFYKVFSPDGTTAVFSVQDSGATWIADLESGEFEEVDWGVVNDVFSWQRRAP